MRCVRDVKIGSWMFGLAALKRTKRTPIFVRIGAWIFLGDKSWGLGGNYCLSLRESWPGFFGALRLQDLEEIIAYL
jgi:hypothetical protein